MDVTEKILCVDDEAAILEGFRRVLRKEFKVDLAVGGPAALKMVEESGPYAVIVSDLRMPDMDGIHLLSKVKEIAPDTIRIMLTGKADVEAAIKSINEGQLFRFLTKPCPVPLLVNALNSALKQYQLVTAEKTLLERTLKGSVTILTDILAIVNPIAFSRASRIKRFVHHLAVHSDPDNLWQYELGAMLSQIGCVTLPPEVLEKVNAGQKLSDAERDLYQSHPQVCYQLLANIPRLEKIAQMIANQYKPKSALIHDVSDEMFLINNGAEMLKVAYDYDTLISRGISGAAAIKTMMKSADVYNIEHVKHLNEVQLEDPGYISYSVMIDELSTLMIIDEDVHTNNGLMLVAKGQTVSYVLLKRLQSFAHGIGIKEPIRVLINRDNAIALKLIPGEGEAKRNAA